MMRSDSCRLLYLLLIRALAALSEVDQNRRWEQHH